MKMTAHTKVIVLAVIPPILFALFGTGFIPAVISGLCLLFMIDVLKEMRDTSRDKLPISGQPYEQGEKTVEHMPENAQIELYGWLKNIETMHVIDPTDGLRYESFEEYLRGMRDGIHRQQRYK